MAEQMGFWDDPTGNHGNRIVGLQLNQIEEIKRLVQRTEAQDFVGWYKIEEI